MASATAPDAASPVANAARTAKVPGAAGRVAAEAAPQVVRAMKNLKLALRLRLGRGPLSEEQANAVAAALDAAATGVERT